MDLNPDQCRQRAQLFPDIGYFWNDTTGSCMTQAERELQIEEAEFQLLGYVPKKKVDMLEEAAKKTGLPQGLLLMLSVVGFVAAIGVISWVTKD